MRLEMELIDVRTGELLRTFDPVAGPVDSVEALVDRLAGAATAGAVAHLDPEAPGWMAAFSLPVSMEAYVHYRRQWDLFCELEYTESIEEGRRAVDVSPEYIPALLTMGVALSNLGREEEADSVFALLSGLGDRMTTSERLTVDWMKGNRGGDPALATRAAEEGYRLDPAGWAGNAMLTAWRTNRMNDAVERYYAMDRPGGCIWLGIWTQGATAFHALERYGEELAVAREGLQYWPDDRALMDIEIRAFAGMGRLDAVDSVLQVMESLPPQSGSDPALRPIWGALELRAHGHEANAEALFDEAIEQFAARELVAASPENLTYLGFHGATLARLGEREQALELADRAGSVTGSDLRGSNIVAQARIAAALGDADEAIRLFQEAFDHGASHGVWIHRDPALESIRGNPQFESLMRPR
jgi:tetratricopeptide (TPR) repeat protein